MGRWKKQLRIDYNDYSLGPATNVLPYQCPSKVEDPLDNLEDPLDSLEDPLEYEYSSKNSFQQQHKHRKLHPYLQLQHELIGCNEPTAIIDHGGAMIMIGVFMLLSYMLQLQIRMKLTVRMLPVIIILLIILKTMTIMLTIRMMILARYTHGWPIWLKC